MDKNVVTRQKCKVQPVSPTVSLTVAKVLKGRFRLWIIPHTYAVTTLRDRGVGDPVNLEADILGKYVERFVRTRRRR